MKTQADIKVFFIFHCKGVGMLTSSPVLVVWHIPAWKLWVQLWGMTS